MYLLVNFLVPLAWNILRQYMNSPSSRYDEMILNGTKDTVQYLCNKDNNTVNAVDYDSIAKSEMKGVN